MAILSLIGSLFTKFIAPVEGGDHLDTIAYHGEPAEGEPRFSRASALRRYY